MGTQFIGPEWTVLELVTLARMVHNSTLEQIACVLRRHSTSDILREIYSFDGMRVAWQRNPRATSRHAYKTCGGKVRISPSTMRVPKPQNQALASGSE